MSLAELSPPVPLDFKLAFTDNSTFSLPKDWEDIFTDTYGFDPKRYSKVKKRLQFVTKKYTENRAFPSERDGMLTEVDYNHSDYTKYYDRDFYFDHYDQWPSEGRLWLGKTLKNPPTHAQIASAVLFNSMIPIIHEKLRRVLTERGTAIASEFMLPNGTILLFGNDVKTWQSLEMYVSEDLQRAKFSLL